MSKIERIMVPGEAIVIREGKPCLAVIDAQDALQEVFLKVGRNLDGYRSVRDIADVDIAAIAPCLAVRHFWLLGEYAGRIDVWGTQTLPLPILRKSAQLMRQWASMDAGAIARG